MIRYLINNIFLILKLKDQKLKVDFITLAVSNFFDERTLQITAKYFYDPLGFNYFLSDENTRRIYNSLYQDTRNTQQLVESNYFEIS